MFLNYSAVSIKRGAIGTEVLSTIASNQTTLVTFLVPTFLLPRYATSSFKTVTHGLQTVPLHSLHNAPWSRGFKSPISTFSPTFTNFTPSSIPPIFPDSDLLHDWQKDLISPDLTLYLTKFLTGDFWKISQIYISPDRVTPGGDHAISPDPGENDIRGTRVLGIHI